MNGDQLVTYLLILVPIVIGGLLGFATELRYRSK
jgi:hypothetical protein